MAIDRREFVTTVASAAVIAVTVRGLRADSPTTDSAPAGLIIDAGSASAFTTDGIYEATRDQGCFIIRRDEEIIALSSICTHRGCKVHSQPDGSYVCKCHGSTFDRDGKVTKGPAKQDLPRLAVAVGSDQHVEVDLRQKFAPGHFVSPASQ